MLNPRWATLGVASLAMFLTVWASDAAQEPQESAKDAPKATPKKILSQLKQALVAEPGKTPAELPKIPPPDPRAALLPQGFAAEVVMADLTYPTSVESDDAGNLYVAEAGYNYGDDAAPARVWRVGADGARQVAADQAERHARLEAWARDRFPMMRDVQFRWSGQVMETIDGLAFIGRNPLDAPNVFIVTGDSGMGMTHGTVAGILLTELILGREHPWATLYDPSRKTLRAAGEFARENLNVVRQYGDWLTGGDVGSAEQVGPGTGALVRRGLTKVAAYRDEQGALHECSAVCPHLG